MSASKALIFFLIVIIGLAALYPALSRHPVTLFVLKGEDEVVEAFRVSAPLNGRDVSVETVPLNPAQKKEGGEILGQKDLPHLESFSRNFGVFPAVIGIPVTQEGWPGFLGGGIKGFFIDPMPDAFNNLQWTDRFYMAVNLRAFPPEPFTAIGQETAAPDNTTAGIPTPGLSPVPNPAPTPGVLRVEILNGCGITNAADWVARRVKGPGIVITDTGNADNFHYPQTIIRTCAGKPVALQEAVERLGLSVDAVQEIPSLNSPVDAVVIVGKDFIKLRRKFRERNRH